MKTPEVGYRGGTVTPNRCQQRTVKPLFGSLWFCSESGLAQFVANPSRAY